MNQFHQPRRAIDITTKLMIYGESINVSYSYLAIISSIVTRTSEPYGNSVEQTPIGLSAETFKQRLQLYPLKSSLFGHYMVSNN